MYPEKFGEQVNEQQKLTHVQARKEQFESVLQQAAKDLIPDPAVNTAPTLDAIDRGMERLRSEVDQLRQRRQTVLAEAVAARPPHLQEVADTALAERRLKLSLQWEKERDECEKVANRLRELLDYHDSVTAELNRLMRADSAGELFAALRVTQCPVCDRKITPSDGPNCYLCQRPLAGRPGGEVSGARKRLAFEIEQLDGEKAELAELLGRLGQERQEFNERVRRLDEEIAEVETRLQPVRTAFAALMPPEIAIIDTEVGQKQERIAQLLRLREAVLHRDELTAEIDRLRAKVVALSRDVDAEAGKVPFERLSDELSDGINEYLNFLNEGDPSRWPHGAIRFELGETFLRIWVGQKRWSSLGATSVGYVLLGYHYALLKLSGRDGYNYPGLALIDFPMTLADKTTIADKENFLIEPFVRLFRSRPTFQLIVCGRAFEGLEGAHRITLPTVWKQEEADGLVAPETPASDVP